ncbi:mediator of DNA damage checkpoint protein 1 isoform X9 [Artibeus jamaicensis]|uniref:mediator of DNA damage checkpoint protein 1 isoform X9 n=1 Tax=Artibeus jamaicensis TaxID=9417 RepID=UPI00235A8DA2|nr:mediator of DNA damage checkpoint protein 1 isoform X9 [Artibeus jamaicensis]
MEDTQAINWEVEEEEETERPSDSLGSSLEPLGRLRIFSSVHGPEKDFPLYLGKNVVGRMPDCAVALPFPTISKQHAVIEILAWNKAAVLQDCGSLNGTQILRPPKFLNPGVSHHLRDKELVVFADLPCQYHRLDVSLPFVSWGPLTVQETPRVQGGAQPWGNLLAEDSEEEVDPFSERCMVEEPRTMFPLLATVVPESDEEGPSAPDGPGPPCAFNFDSDTDEEESPQPAVGEACSAATRDATAETEQPKAVTTEIHCEMNQHSGKERNNDARAERDTSNGVVPVGMILERSQPAKEDSETGVDDESRPPGRSAEVHLERAQLSDFIDSDTDMEEEEIPATPAVVPVKKRQIFHGVSTESPGGPDLAHLEESLAGSDTDVETESPFAVPLGRSQASMVINSNTDDEEEVSAALTLARLKESHAAVCNKDIDMEEDQAQPLDLFEQSQTSSGRDSDTEVEKEKFPVEKREYVHKGHTGKVYSENSQPPFRASVREVKEDKSSSGVSLERSQASTKVGISTQVEEEMPPGPAVILPEKHQVPVSWTSQTNVKAEGGPAKLPVMHLEEAQPPPGGDSEAEADVRKSQFLTEGVVGTEWVVSVLQQEGVLEAGAQGEPPVAQVEQDHLVSRENVTALLVDTGTPGEPNQPQRKGFAQPPRERGREPCVDTTKDSGDNHDDSENLDLQATQCFVERENQSMEGALDEPWEVLATQPFCLREFEASDTQPVSAHLEAYGSCPFSPKATPQDQHPESPLHAEPLGIQDRGMQTAEKALIASGSQSGGRRGAPLSHGRWQRGHLSCKMPPAERVSRGDPESLDACVPPMVPEASVPGQNPLICQNQKHPAPQPLFAPSPPFLEPLIPRTRQNGSQEVLENPLSSELDLLHAKPKVRPRRCSKMTSSPVSSVASESHPSASKDKPITPEPTSRATRGRKQRSSVKTPKPVVPAATECQPSTSKDQPVTPEPTSRATRGRTQRSSVKTPKPVVPAVTECQPSTSKDQPVTPEPTSRATRGRTQRSSVKTPKPVVPTVPECQPSTSKDQPVTPEPTSRATRGRTQRSSVKTPKPVVPTVPECQPSTSKDQPVTPEPTSRATRGRTQRSSVKTPNPVVPTIPECQPSTSKDQPVIPEPTSRATQGRTQRSSVKTPKPVVPAVPECQPSTSKDQPVTPEPTSRATRGRTQRSSVKTPNPVVPTIPECQPSTSKDQPVNPKAIAQSGWSRTLRRGSAVPVPATPEFQSPGSTDQPISPEPIPQTNCSRRPRATRKNGSLTTPIVYEPCSAPLEPNFQSSRNQSRALRVSKSLRAIPKPAFAQLPEASTHVSQIQKVEAGGRYEFTPKTQPKAFRNRKRPFSAVDSSPLQKQLQREEVHQKTVFLKKGEDPTEKEEDIVTPGPGKRKKGQAEEPKAVPGRSLRRTKPKQESAAPKVLFTGVVDARGEQAVLALGGSLASSVTEASHLVTDRICRTVKFLCALGRGIPILSLDWLHQSHKAGCFLPPDEYVVTDSEQEKNFGFSLRDSLSRARERKLLEGYEIHVTPGVQPPPPQMAEIISCCGGTVLPSMPRSYKPQRVVITCSQDVPRCNTPIRAGLPILSPEFLLTGVLKQEATPEAFVFSTLEVSCT